MTATAEKSGSPGFIRIQVDQYRQKSVAVNVACLTNDRYSVLLEECPISRRHQIALLERVDGREGPVVSQLFTYDLNSAFELVEKLMTHDDPLAFCGQLAVIFADGNPRGPIPLDPKPAQDATVS